ncbi:MAG TPA: hypothetical protein VF407_22665 [Polyangiaceae bacterium]
MRRALVIALFAGSAAAVGCSLFVDLGELQDGGGVVTTNDAATSDVVVIGDGGGPAPDGSACGSTLVDDARNCGACGHDCLGGTCADRVCQPYLFSRFDGDIADLVCDDRAAYWLLVETTQPGVHRRAFADVGSGVALFDVPNDSSEIAVDGTRIYVSEGTADGGVVAVADKTTPGPTTTLASYGGSHLGNLLALGDDRIFLGQFPGANDGLIGVFAKDGGAYLSTYATGGNFMVQLGQSNGTLFAVVSSGVPETIRSLPAAGGSFTDLTGSEGVSEATSLGLDDAGLAWVTYAGHVGYLDRVNGGAVRELFVDGGPVTSVGLGSDRIYATVDPDAGDDAGTVVTMGRDGAGPTVVATGQAHPRMLRACGPANVWVTGTDSIMAQAR